MSDWFHSDVGPLYTLMELKWLKFDRMEWCFNLRSSGATSGKWSIIDGKDKEWYVDIRRSKMVAPACVDWGPFVVDPWMSIWLCTDCMPDLWGPVNRRSSMIVVTGWCPTIPLEMNIGIMYGPPTDSTACGIAWKTYTRERWDPDQLYGIIVKGCHTWPVHGHVYVMLVGFIHLQG
jgi:hypothetical protein